MQRLTAVALAFGTALILVCDVSVVAVHYLNDHTSLINDTRTTKITVPQDVKVVPSAGQAFVTGTIDHITLERAQMDALKMPLTISSVDRGIGRATIEKALVFGQRQTITWDGGTPLPVSGPGTLDIGAAKVDADAGGVTILLDGQVRTFSAGTYSLGTTVAVGSGGLAAPRDGVSFTADSQTVMTTRNNVVLKLDPAKINLLGPGKITMNGAFKVQFPDRTVDAKTVNFGEGPYRVTLDPGNGKLSIDAILQGDVQTS